MVSIAAQQVREGQLRSDAELRDDLACDGDEAAMGSLLRTHELALQLLRTRYAPDPMTPQVEAQLERKVATLRGLMNDPAG
ncbi:MAG TPA: hypothetical protein VGQ50_15430 [Actinomycetota bacterium]|nr:hypothetical protein [Actinomycetota bacterium]